MASDAKSVMTGLCQVKGIFRILPGITGHYRDLKLLTFQTINCIVVSRSFNLKKIKAFLVAWSVWN